MDVREKLDKLLSKWLAHLSLSAADDLIANGVTVQEWISVKDRLPEDWITVLVFVPSIGAIIPAKLRGGSWYSTWDTTRLKNVSYWMPMPKSPNRRKENDYGHL